MHARREPRRCSVTKLGWSVMLLSWSAILMLCCFCFWKILHTRRDNIHAPLDIDTGDLDEGQQSD